jgi:hypothetical protein
MNWQVCKSQGLSREISFLQALQQQLADAEQQAMLDHAQTHT